LHWIAVLKDLTTCSLAATSGVHDGADALKLLLAGADVVMSTSALLIHGPERLAHMEAEMRAWMDEREYDSVEQLKGSVSRRNVPDPQIYERANYYQALRFVESADENLMLQCEVGSWRAHVEQRPVSAKWPESRTKS
jgi:dihydroorotate dehydrogenase (fumarate)